MRYIGMPEAMHRDRVGKADDLAYFLVRLQGARMSAAAVGEGGRAADVFVLPLDGGIFLLNLQLGRLLLRPKILQFGLPQLLGLALLDLPALLVELTPQTFQVLYRLTVQNDEPFTGFRFRHLRDFFAIGIDGVFVDHHRFAVLVIVAPCQRQSLTQPQAGMEDKQQLISCGMDHKCLTGILRVFLRYIGAAAFCLV